MAVRLRFRIGPSTIGLLAGAIVTASTFFANAAGYVPKGGFVPNATVATKISEAVLIPIYGEKVIAVEKPFRAQLHGNVWTVEGSLPKNVVGGVAIIQIDKRDGRILYVMHGK